MELRILNATDVHRALPMSIAIKVMKEAFAQLSTGRAIIPLRTRIDVKKQAGVVLFMPGFLEETKSLAMKVVSVFPNNITKALPTIHALVIIIDADTGQPVALLEGAKLTAIRTGAASGAATDLLARPESKTVAIFGSGTQARTQLEGVCAVRLIESVWVYDIDIGSVEAFAAEMAGQGNIPNDIHIAVNPDEAVVEADIICTATISPTPVFNGKVLKPGTHINAIGSFTPTMQEIDAVTISRSVVVVDSRQAVLEETGDLIIPIQIGVITPDWIHAELGEVITGDKPGRISSDQITLFKSVGVAAQDAIAAQQALFGAMEAGLGQIITL